ncbi:MAG TPA: hypothetical protein PKD10_12230 [Paracoccaceae bacterium]|nr:hypothetical protein [Paracoccaceae bacterium]HMO71735.1 hypothetical protein [Paracoccaceae bacterium]
MIRPELAALFHRWREVIAAGAVAALGMWLAGLGGPLPLAAGALLGLGGAGWALTAWRRVRFAQDVAAPGLVEVTEGRIGYFGPSFGGFIDRDDLAEIRLVTQGGRRVWRLSALTGEVLLVPVDAQGADRLLDAFAALPGLDAGALVAALSPGGGGAGGGLPAAGPVLRTVWRRPGSGLAPR